MSELGDRRLTTMGRGEDTAGRWAGRLDLKFVCGSSGPKSKIEEGIVLARFRHYVQQSRKSADSKRVVKLPVAIGL